MQISALISISSAEMIVKLYYENNAELVGPVTCT